MAEPRTLPGPGRTVGAELSLHCLGATFLSHSAQCDHCVWREEGRARHLHLTSLRTWHTTSAQVSLHSWKRSAEVFYFPSSDAVIPHVREPTMQLQWVEHAPLLKIPMSFFI